MALASSRRRGITSCSAGSSLTARALCPVSRHSTDIDMLVSSFDQIVSRISATSGDSIEASEGLASFAEKRAANWGGKG
jgi:hypothetical protein